MKLQICLRTVNFDLAGLTFLLFTPALWRLTKNQSSHFCSFPWDGCDYFKFLNVKGGLSSKEGAAVLSSLISHAVSGSTNRHIDFKLLGAATEEGPTVIPVLINGLIDNDEWVRRESKESLRHFGTQALPYLSAVSKLNDPEAARAAEELEKYIAEARK